MKKDDVYKSQNNKFRNKLGRVTQPVYEVPENLRTQQQFKNECDINRIVENAKKGIPPRFLARGEPHYGDFSRVPDLTEAYNITQRANEAFLSLPSKLRLELDNDPANIGNLTKDQIERYDLGKKLPISSPADPDPVSPAGGGSSAPKAPTAPSTASKTKPASSSEGA